MVLTREERKRKLSDRGRRGAEARWAAYHAAIPQPNYGELPDDMFEITVKNLMTEKTDVLLFHPDRSRSGRYHIDVNGQYWKTCGWTDATVRIRKSCKRMPIINL